MYKTIWLIIDNTGNESYTAELTYYHFGKEPKFPTWYMEDESHSYTIKMIGNLKLINKLSPFFKCLFHYYIIK